MAIDTVIFDLGGVLIDWDPRRLYRRLFDEEAEVEHFLATVCTPAWSRTPAGRCARPPRRWWPSIRGTRR
ncbi:hypothetical protein [Frateuria defendens]|uniref:hypothetical protein n=1 Tax=Frateuria defendens TaxID=2219559 RepID=UPI0030166B19